jgi:MYXO-CTERM domain-containing protein
MKYMHKVMLLSLSGTGLLAASNAHAATIAAQNFNNISNANTTTETLASGSLLTGAATSRGAGTGIDFSTRWFQSRTDMPTGPKQPTNDTSDFIGGNIFTASNSPTVGPTNVAVAAGVEQNFEFNDCDGVCEVRFAPVDVSGRTNRAVRFFYWVNNDSFEGDSAGADSLVVTVSGNSNSVTVLNLDSAALGAAVKGSWIEVVFPLEASIASLGTSLTLTVRADNNATAENLFIDNVEFVDGFIDTPAVDRTVMQIQGSTVSIGATTCVVTADLKTNTVNRGMSGFYCQDPTGDGNANTSDGIFVLNTSSPVTVGRSVRVTGTVQEREPGTTNQPATGVGGIAGSETAISATLVEDLAAGVVPAATPVTFPIDDNQLERFEGMLVRIDTTEANDRMQVQQNFFLGRYGQLTLASPAVGSNQLTRLITPSQAFAPNAPAATTLWQNNQNRLLVLDDSMDLSATGDNPNPSPFNNDCNSNVRAGSSVGNLTGILEWGRINSAASDNSDYRLQVTPSTITVANGSIVPAARPAVPSAPGELSVVAFNVLNYFTDFQTGAPPGSDFRGAFTAAEFRRQTDKIVSAICALNADALGLVELQNEATDLPVEVLLNGDNGARFGGQVIVGVNQVCGLNAATRYEAIKPGVSGTDAIKNGLIYRTSKLTTSGGFSLITDPSPTQQSRPTLVQSFRTVTGNRLVTLAVNHFKSKRDSCSDATTTFAGPCNAQRLLMANTVRNSLNALSNTPADPRYIVALGDLNAYAEEEPIAAFTTNTWVDPVRNALGASAQDFVFDGQLGTISYALVNSTAAAKVVSADEWRINSDEADLLEYGTPPWYVPAACYAPNAFRSADHDPIRLVLNLSGVRVPFFGGNGPLFAGLGLLGLGALLTVRRRRNG